MTTAFAPETFDPTLANPTLTGLWGATNWTEEAGALRWLDAGIDFRVWNYGGEDAFGVWRADWCAAEADLDPQTDVKRGARPAFPDTFLAFTFWASDECDLRASSQAEVRTRAAQVYRLQEPIALETEFAPRMLADAGAAVSATDIVDAVAKLEGAIAKTSTLGVIHASAELAAHAAHANLIRYQNGKLVTPLGHLWAFGGGYVDALGAKMVATSPLYGWLGDLNKRESPSLRYEKFQAVVERSLVVGYEAAIAAVEIA